MWAVPSLRYLNVSMYRFPAFINDIGSLSHVPFPGLCASALPSEPSVQIYLKLLFIHSSFG